MKVLRFACRTLAVISLAAPSVAYAETNSDAQDAFEDMITVFTSGDGVWVQRNEGFVDGDDAPEYWVQQAWRGPGPLTLIRDSYAVSAAGVCMYLNHNVTVWDVPNQTVRMFAVAPGMVAEGEYTFPEKNKAQLVISGVLPNGAPLEMKDVTDFSTQGVQYVQATRKQDGEWGDGDSATWLSSEDSNPCAGN